MTLLSTIAAAGLAVSLSSLATGCKQEVAASQQATTASEPVKAEAAESTIVKAVFVGRQNACDCTRRSVEAGWAALQRALGTPAKLPVERLDIDTERVKLEPYRKQEAMMALPAIYFVDEKATVLELLQGEVTDAQITAVLERR